MTLAEWDAAAAKLSKKDATKLLAALDKLATWDDLKKEFGWTGLFALRWTLQARIDSKES